MACLLLWLVALHALLLTWRASVAVGVRCDAPTAWCSQMCVDVGDNYECRCHVGYRLSDKDGQSCAIADGKSCPYVDT